MGQSIIVSQVLIAGRNVVPLKALSFLVHQRKKKSQSCVASVVAGSRLRRTSRCIQNGWFSSVRKKQLPATDFSLDRSFSRISQFFRTRAWEMVK